jgi:hypothetical protein
VIEVPQGFVTDYASIPPVVRPWLERHGSYSRAAVIHDYLYWSQICTKTQADNIMLIAMQELRVPRRKRWAIHQAVSLFGRSAWANNQAERQAGKPKVLPADLFGMAENLTWPQARHRLIAAGIRDPIFPKNPQACALGNGTKVP